VAPSHVLQVGVGFGLHAALDPPLYVSPFAVSAGRRGGTVVNDQALGFERFEGVEEAPLELYAVRNAYLSRQQAIAGAIVGNR
jgi:hypothetical protein